MPAAVSPAPRTAHLMEMVAKYDGRVPRYTSYPTAVQFTPEVTSAVYRRWLSELPVDEAVSLYVHIPLCARLCWYCGCNTRAVNRAEAVSDYVRILTDELATAEPLLPGRLSANALHLGGGTPNMLAVDDMAVLFGALRQLFRFSPEAEIAAELDPAVLTEAWVRAAASHGLNRASLGVQNLSPEVQAAVNRPERYEDIAQCVVWLREAGVASVNLDLMYGLPRQTTANTLATIDQVMKLKPERIALFGYAHVPWMKSHQQLIDEKALPGPAERLDQSETAAERLTGEGYVRIGLDHFALPTDDLAIAQGQGRLHRNFQGYTTDTAGTLLGFGTSAISALPQGYVQNIPQELAWRTAVAGGEPPIARGVALNDDDRWRGEIIERLMCDMTVDLGAVSGRYGRDWRALAPELERLADFVRDGLVEIEGPVLRTTEVGRLLVRSVCAVFDVHLAPEAVRHSRAI